MRSRSALCSMSATRSSQSWAGGGQEYCGEFEVDPVD
jgi:hypothetical protein